MSTLTRRQILLATLAGGAACKPKRSSGFSGHAFVASEEGRAIAAVDLTGFVVSHRIAVNGAPVAVKAHPQRASVYVLLSGTPEVSEIDAKRFEVSRRATLTGEGVQFQLDPKGETLWVAIRKPAQLLPIATETMKAGAPIALPAAPVAFEIAMKTGAAAVSLADGSVVIADLASRKAFAPIPLSAEVGPVAFRLDGLNLLVADKAQRRLSVIDVAQRRVIVHLPLSLRPDRFCMKADGGQLFLTGEGRDAVVVAYPYRTEIAQTAISGRQPGAMAVSDVPEYLLVANPSAGSVTIFDIATQKVLAVTQVGADPSSIIVTPDQQYALVLNRGSGDMAVIRIKALSSGRTKTASLFTMIPIGAKPVAAAIVAS